MRSYTNIEQSKVLSKILPLESADMRYGYIAPYDFSDRMHDGGYDDVPYPKDFMKKNPNFSEDEYDGEFPCWSLAALLSFIPCSYEVYRHPYDDGLSLSLKISNCIEVTADNEIDACYKMILKLHELKML